MAAAFQGFDSAPQTDILYEDIVRIEGRNGEDGDSGGGQQGTGLGQNAHDTEIYGAGQLQDAPAFFLPLGALGDPRPADQGNFLGRPCEADKKL